MSRPNFTDTILLALLHLFVPGQIAFAPAFVVGPQRHPAAGLLGRRALGGGGAELVDEGSGCARALGGDSSLNGCGGLSSRLQTMAKNQPGLAGSTLGLGVTAGGGGRAARSVGAAPISVATRPFLTRPFLTRPFLDSTYRVGMYCRLTNCGDAFE